MKAIEPLTDFDREIWYEELEDFVPEKVFDAHTHLWDDSLAPNGSSRLANINYDALNKFSGELFPNRKLGYFMLMMPLAGMNVELSHEFLAAEIAKSEHKLGATVVTPAMSANELDNVIKKYHFAALKPYRTFADDPANCRITDYFPEELIEVADQHKLAVVMHMSRMEGIADPENIADFEYFTSKYKNVRWILAHCARAFNHSTIEKNVFRLREIPNIYYDLSAVCDVRSHYLLFKHEELSRIMFGTDNLAGAGLHGIYVPWGKGWQFIKGPDVPHCRKDSTFVSYESLRTIKQAADMAGLDKSQIEDIFYNNAAKFFDF